MAITDATSALSTVLQLAYARTVVVRDVDASLEGHHGLGLNDLALLLELNSSPNGRLRRLDLAERLGITPSGVARQLAPLERRGLVGRESHPDDARLAIVVLTEAGTRVVGELLPTAEEAATRVLGKLWNDEEQHSASALLQRART
ncbi:MAG TPA: MarR family transcriptional regulator [Gaiellales bacterium]|jgi:DNA-binding MarR family transcriptional regulator|nr:MarR family transcriptional regulator [Gaiellales bacterium]